MKPRRSPFLRCVAGASAVFAFAGLAPLGTAQQPPESAPVAAPAPRAPAAIQPIPPAGDGDAMVDNIKLSDNPLTSVLDLLEQLTGRSVIRPQQLPTPTFTFNSHGPITKRDAIIALESLLSLNNIAVAPLGEKFIKVVVITNIKTEAPELVLGSLADQPPSGRIVSKLFRLEHLDTTTFQTQVQPFLSPGFGAVVPFQNSSTILVTDTISNLQRLEYVLEQVDKPRDLVTKFYTLKFAQAQEVAEKIKSLIESTRTAFNKQAGQGGGAPAALTPQGVPAPTTGEGSADAAAAGLGAALISATTSINFDERTNQVILVTDSSSVQFYENLIEKLDVQADPSTQIAVIQIQHADAKDVASLLSTFISGSSGSASRSSSSGGRTSRPQRSRETFPGMGRDRERTESNTPPATSQPLVAASARGAGNERNSQFSDFMTIIADERSNAIVASGTQDDLNLVRALIKQVDVILPQVQIDVLIASVNVGKSVQRGIDAFTNITVAGNRVVGIEGVSGPGYSLSNIVVNQVTGGSDTVSGKANLNTKSNVWNNVRVLSVPSITTTHNQEAEINVAKSVPIITSSYSDTTSTTTARNAYTYQDVGIKLFVKPLIGADGTIQMEIEQNADEIESFNADGQPLISTRKAKSFISVSDGEIIVLGGLQKDTNGKTRGGFPLISEIPVLGALFGSNKTEKSRDEVLFFIQPRILRTTADADRTAREQMETSAGKKMVEKRVQRKVVLPPEPPPAE
ncbi:MAG TPA: secretin N-terminal domain-containing protein [Opitutaceae bacterium]|nr:secretin N-terminal domain-containing protein [Opitutaceae bacterium]